jgi:hypothetical protein
MKTLFLFFSQSEIGAPDYLSRTGEQGVETFTETIVSFLTNSLQIKILDGYEKRAKSLNEELVWRSFKEQGVFQKAVQASLRLYSEILIVSGNDSRTFKTCEVLAKDLALPICVDNRFDKHELSNPKIGGLNDALENLIQFITDENCPKVILVGTSLDSILEWIKQKNIKDYSANFDKILRISSENDTIPTVFISGFVKENNVMEWIFDLPKETH